MCGLVGVWSSRPEDTNQQQIERMMSKVVHRGPDSSGLWIDQDAGIGLGHRRLAIVDLSTAGQQPMHSPSGRFVVVLNGELYNHLDLRRKLTEEKQLVAWRGHSDTETLVNCIEAWGLTPTLQQVTGMFAIAVWDRLERTLSLARDRIGEKPLYYGRQGAALLFASELGAIRSHTCFNSGIDRSALALMMRHNYIPAPYSIYENVSKLVPGTAVTFGQRTSQPVPVPYWSAHEVVTAGQRHPFQGTPLQAADKLESLIRASVDRQMMSDVPLGAFLSGGIDSSTVVSLMQSQSQERVRTFSIGFNEQHYDEAPYAKAVAKHLGTYHTEWYVTPEDALNVVPRLPEIFSEPFADSSQLPTYLVSKLAKSAVTVALSGDGGDELFGGYPRYAHTDAYWQSVTRIPLIVRRPIASMVDKASAIERLLNVQVSSHRLRTKQSRRNLRSLLNKAASVFGTHDLTHAYQRIVSHWAPPTEIVRDAAEPPTALMTFATGSAREPIHHMMAVDLVSYLPDDILCKVDRASMAVSLESRVPLLDHSIVEFAWTLPLTISRHKGIPKWPLREVLNRYVPPSLTDRPKMGFGVPIDQWLRGSLRDWAEDLLCDRRLASEGFFNPNPIRRKWDEHVSGRANWQYHLWDVLMFQAWHAANR